MQAATVMPFPEVITTDTSTQHLHPETDLHTARRLLSTDISTLTLYESLPITTPACQLLWISTP